MGKLLPIGLYAAFASLTLVGVVPQQPVSAPTGIDAPKGGASEAAQQSPPPPISFDAITPAVFDRQEDGNPRAFVFLKNDGPAAQVAEFSAVLLNRLGEEVAVTVDPARASVPPGRPTVARLQLKAGATAGRGASADEFWRARLPLRGFLVLQTVRAAAPPASVTRELLVAPPQPAPQVDSLVLASLLAALLIVAIGTAWAGVGKVTHATFRSPATLY